MFMSHNTIKTDFTCPDYKHFITSTMCGMAIGNWSYAQAYPSLPYTTHNFIGILLGRLSLRRQSVEEPQLRAMAGT